MNEIIEQYKRNIPEEGEFIQLIPEGGLQIDVGGAFGFWTIAMLKKAELVWTFEPDKRLIKEYLNNIPTDKLWIFPVALSNKSETATLYIRIFEHTGLIQNYHKYAPQKEIKIQTTTLDDQLPIIKFLNKKVTLIKIDTEGADHLILQGAEKLIETHNPLIIVEYHNNEKEISEIMQKHNYTEIKHIHRTWNEPQYKNGLKAYKNL